MVSLEGECCNTIFKSRHLINNPNRTFAQLLLQHEAELRIHDEEDLSSWNDDTWIPERGDVVLAQHQVYPPWPALVTVLYPHATKNFRIAVKFLGEVTLATLPKNRVWKHASDRSAMIS